MGNIDLETGVKVNITSPYYPGEYPNSAYKRWEISSPPGLATLLQFIAFNLELGFDYLSVYTGTIPSLSNSTRIADFTGQSLPGDTISYEPYMWLVFQSDYSINAGGFLAEVSAINVVTGKYACYCFKNYMAIFRSLSGYVHLIWWNVADLGLITFRILIISTSCIL